MRGYLLTYLFLALDVYYYLLWGHALMSWLPALAQSRLGQFVTFLVEPLLKPLKRLPLQFGGLDFSVVVATIAIQALKHLLWLLLG